MSNLLYPGYLEVIFFLFTLASENMRSICRLCCFYNKTIAYLVAFGTCYAHKRTVELATNVKNAIEIIIYGVLFVPKLCPTLCQLNI